VKAVGAKDPTSGSFLGFVRKLIGWHLTGRTGRGGGDHANLFPFHEIIHSFGGDSPAILYNL
jgi:hypothetical protein